MLYTATSAVASSAYFRSRQDEKSPGCATQHGETIVPKTTSRPDRYLENVLAVLQVSLYDIQAELLASQHQHFMQLFCSNHWNNTFRLFQKWDGPSAC